MGRCWSSCWVDSFAALVWAGMASLERVAQDGVRGVDKVKASALWYALAYNMART